MKVSTKNFFRNLFIIIFLFICLILTLVSTYSSTVISDISDNILRLHVIANSNSAIDQNVKYKVRDALLDYVNNNTEITSKKDAIEFINSNINELIELSNKILAENNCNYSTNISIEKSDFPTKTYANTSFPAGNYEAVRVELGNYSGENWWCVMFPPLCFTEFSDGILSEEASYELQENLNTEEYRLITSTDTDIKVKFKLIEWLEKF